MPLRPQNAVSNICCHLCSVEYERIVSTRARAHALNRRLCEPQTGGGDDENIPMPLPGIEAEHLCL